MKITFVYHSCYVIELEDLVLVFDYFKGQLPEWERGKKVFFFASHKHADHFSLDILKYKERYEDITYVFSNDIKFTDKFLMRHGINSDVKKSITRVGKNMRVQISVDNQDMVIETLHSTDEGVAFIIQYKGKTIYHAGDLSWWSWEGESEKDYIEMSRAYQNEINKLSRYKIDVAFVVLDPRQGERYWWGLDYFLKTVNAQTVLPMHCWEKYDVVKQFKEEKVEEGYNDRLLDLEYESQVFIIE